MERPNVWEAGKRTVRYNVLVGAMYRTAVSIIITSGEDILQNLSSFGLVHERSFAVRKPSQSCVSNIFIQNS